MDKGCTWSMRAFCETFIFRFYTIFLVDLVPLSIPQPQATGPPLPQLQAWLADTG